VVHQPYDVYVDTEHVILGNDGLLKCRIPSFVADQIFVSGWVDDLENSFLPESADFHPKGRRRIMSF
jgi:hypothetical protein